MSPQTLPTWECLVAQPIPQTNSHSSVKESHSTLHILLTALRIRILRFCVNNRRSQLCNPSTKCGAWLIVDLQSMLYSYMLNEWKFLLVHECVCEVPEKVSDLGSFRKLALRAVHFWWATFDVLRIPNSPTLIFTQYWILSFQGRMWICYL